MKSLFALFGAAVLLSFSGCAVMPVYPEVAGLTFLHGELVARLGGSLYEVAEGVRGASHRLQLAPVRESSDPVQARMVTYDPHGTRVVIRLIPVSDQVTEVRIQADVLGDEGYSRRILKEIQKHVP
jgi:hypothetical protein